MESLNLTVILPTLNEADNLNILIPEIQQTFKSINLINYQILVVDDGSEDNTHEVIENLNKQDSKINIISRKSPRSLPDSIWDGIDNSVHEYVMWLDADGSMTALAIKDILLKLQEDKNAVVIGSRFVNGGGYKGVLDIEKTSFFTAIKNVRKSNDSVLGMMVSIIFNKLLNYIFPYEIKDITSGFIVGNKKYFNKESFDRASYGDYFLFVVNDLAKKNIKMIEVGYICETRISGESKTASSIIQLIKRGIPYIKGAIIARKEINENI